MNTVNKGPLLPVFLFCTNPFCNFPVGKKHEIFDQLIGIFHLPKIDLKRNTLFIESEPDLLCLKIEGAFFKSVLPQFFCDFIKNRYFIRIFTGS